MKYIFILLVIAVAALWIPHRMEQEYAKGLAEGRRTALHTSPVSEELEMVCAGLWVGDQTKKAQAKENAR
jgi:hypothetical protein